MDLIARILLWLEPYLAYGLELLEGGSIVAAPLAIPAGVALGLSPLGYPLVAVISGYVSGESVSGKKLSTGRAAALSGAFVLGICTVYVTLGVLFGALGLALLAALNRSIWLWYALLAPVLWVMGLRTLGVLRLDSPLKHLTPLLRGPFAPVRRDGPTRRGGLLGAYLIGVPAGLAGCPSCALILPALLSAVAASGSPLTGAAAMLMLGLGQGAVLVAAGTFAGSLVNGSRLSGFRRAIEIALGLALLLTAAYFSWRALIWL